MKPINESRDTTAISWLLQLQLLAVTRSSLNLSPTRLTVHCRHKNRLIDPTTFLHTVFSYHSTITMTDSGTGIQELMAAETRASQIVAEARIGEFNEGEDGVLAT
jgi:UDP-N-acetylglucosamine 2-epimerase